MFNYDRYGHAFVDMRLHKLRVLITDQSDDLFVQQGITAPSACTSVLLFLLERQSASIPGASIAGIAEGLGYSHQLINHRLSQLEKMGFTQRFTDERDKRKWRIGLTNRGTEQAKKIEATLPLIASTFDELFADLNIDLSQTLTKLHDNLSRNPLSRRLAASVTEPQS